MPLYVNDTAIADIKVAIVFDPPEFPYPLTLGSLSYSLSFEGFPSGSVTYLGVTSPDMPAIEGEYLRAGWLRSPITINGIEFIVAGFNYERTNYQIADHRSGEIHEFDFFSVSLDLQYKYQEQIDGPVEIAKYVSPKKDTIKISQLAAAARVPYAGPSFEVKLPPNRDKNFRMTLNSAIQAHARRLGCYAQYLRGVRLLPLKGGYSHTFPAHLLWTDGTNSYKIPPTYNDTELTWGDEQKDDDPEKPEWKKIEPKIETLIEEDVACEFPPPNSLILRTLDSNRTHSGPFKTRITRKLVDGTDEKQVTKIWGFEYTSEQIANPDGALQGVAQDYWRVVEEQVQQQIWKELPLVQMRLLAVDPDSQDKAKYRKVILHPDYEPFAEINLMGDFLFKVKTFYNVGTKTTGYSRFSLIKETDNLETLEFGSDLSDPYNRAFYELYQFKKIPFEDFTSFALKSKRVLYRKWKTVEQGRPFSVEWFTYDQLPKRIKKIADQLSTAVRDGRIGVIVPDINYTEPMLIQTETRRKSSFVWAEHPENSPDDPIPPFISGEESYFSNQRNPLKPDKYVEKETSFSSRNSAFVDVAEYVKNRTLSGILPEASSRKQQWEQKEKKDDKPEKKYRYFITSDWVHGTVAHIKNPVSVGYPEAKSLDEALLAAVTDLRIAEMQNSQENKVVTWYHPQIRDGHIIYTGRDRFGHLGRWRVMSMTVSLEFAGCNEKGIVFYPNPLAIANSGTQLTLGLDRSRKLRYRKEPIKDSGKDPFVEVTGTGFTNSLGIVLPQNHHRRKF